MAILARTYTVLGRDLERVDCPGRVEVLHICYPYEGEGFIEATIDYIREYRPELSVIHATVVPGTTCVVHERTASPVAYSPIRGKHARMEQDLLRYTKFVAGMTPAAESHAIEHLRRTGFKVRAAVSCEGLELAKLVETTYFGVLLAWSQEVERFCDALGVDYDEAMALAAEVDYFPSVVFQPGYIGGHCVIPNTYLLEDVRRSPFIDVIRSSNELKREQWIEEGKDLTARLAPKPVPRTDEC